MRTRPLQHLQIQKKTTWFKSIVALACLLLATTSAFAQAKTVTGTVTDAANEPLIGASVLVQGTSTGTITDMDGKYSISVTPEDVLVFSYVGMTSQSIKVGAQTVINVTLKETKNRSQICLSIKTAGCFTISHLQRKKPCEELWVFPGY